MIRELFYELYMFFRRFAGTGAVAVLFIVALIMYAACRKCGEKSGWWRFLSVISAIGCAFSETFYAIVDRYRNKPLYRYLAGFFGVCLMVLAIAASGKSVFSAEFTSRAENDMHIPPGILEAAQYIAEDAENPVVLVMPGWGAYFESFSSGLKMAYHDPENEDASELGEDERTLYLQLQMDNPDMKKIAGTAHRIGCGYVVLSEDLWSEFPITRFGYELMRECDGCLVYREVNSP